MDLRPPAYELIENVKVDHWFLRKGQKAWDFDRYFVIFPLEGRRLGEFIVVARTSLPEMAIRRV